jgi:hypothetical protein
MTSSALFVMFSYTKTYVFIYLCAILCPGSSPGSSVPGSAPGVGESIYVFSFPFVWYFPRVYVTLPPKLGLTNYSPL